jgi:hypothetical protein
MPITAALIMGGGALLGGALAGRSARKAANTQADAQLEAAQIAADEARFRPVGITTRFGQSNFQTDADGRVSGASYTVDPSLRAYQDELMRLAGGGLGQASMAQQQFAPLGQAAQGLFGAGQQYLSSPADQRLGAIASEFLGPTVGSDELTSLGRQYLAESPQQAAQRFMAQQQELLAPTRERQMAQLQQGLFNTGRGGLAVGATGVRPSGAMGLSAASPEAEAYYNALAQQDALLAAQATQGGMDQARFGSGLLAQGQALDRGQVGFGADLLGRQIGMDQDRLRFGGGLFATGGNLLTQGYLGQANALGPFEAYLQQMQNIEDLGQQSLDIGSALGGRIANAQGSSALLSGGTSAANSRFAANAYNPFATALIQGSQNPQFTNALGKYFTSSQTGPFVDVGGYGQAGSDALRQYGI